MVGTTTRTPNNIYVIDEIVKGKCCLGKEDEICLSNRQMGHINLNNIMNVCKREAVR